MGPLLPDPGPGHPEYRGSIELATRAWNMALEKSSEWVKRTEYLVGIEVKHRAWARKLFPTPRLHQQNMLVLDQELQRAGSSPE